MDYLNKDQHFLEEKGALHTAMEISSQPWLWNEIYRRIREERGALGAFLDRVLPGMRKIILTGAGTSAYIGYSLEGVFQRSTGITTVSVPTTHLVSHPADYFDPLTPTLLISFARSGSSPESLATVKLFDRYCPGSAHLVITCNSEGELARHHFRNDCYIFNLPPEANDKSLAMTSSYSGMLLAAYLIGNLHELDALETAVATLCHYGQRILSDYTSTLQEIARMPFQRAVFLGSGPAYGTSRESNLKLQEMTDGQIICKNDSFLGFRHGPRSVVDETTLMVYYFSNKPEVYRYERDFVKSMDHGKKNLFQLGISESKLPGLPLDAHLLLSDSSEKLREDLLPVCYILIGQILGFYKSLELGLQPDSPSKSGAISRVVEGVIIYD